MGQSAKILPSIELKRFFVHIVRDAQATQQIELGASTLPKARKEALSFLGELKEDQGWIELYERNPSKQKPLLIWVGVV
jgi:hypothetical protein